MHFVSGLCVFSFGDIIYACVQRRASGAIGRERASEKDRDRFREEFARKESATDCAARAR